MYWNKGMLCKSMLLIKININMRCIEMLYSEALHSDLFRLTLTWDVLKWKIREQSGLTQQRLTLTWDVLKWSLQSYG